MVDPAYARSAVADLGGKHLQEHKLVFDTPNMVRSSDQRPSSDETPQGSSNHTGGRGSGQSSSEEATNEDDEGDGSAGQEDDQEDEEDDPEVLAPSHGHGKGKGKRPAIRVEPADGDEFLDIEDGTTSLEAGPKTSKHPVSHFLTNNKKRTFSNISSTSLLFGEDDAGFPRPKIARTLSHTGGSGLLTYTTANSKGANGSDNAIESSDEEKDIVGEAEDEQGTNDEDEDYSGVNLISDDESDIDKIEQLEETFIIDDEHHHVPGFFNNAFNDARRLSLDTQGSEDIFDFDAALGGTLYTPANLQDVGFGQFFEPEPRPASPEPMAKRKFSDSSTKRVRFDDEVQVSDSSSESSSELDSAIFPDLFLQQDKLPASLYQLMEEDNDTDNGDYSESASEHSFWDFGQEDNRNSAHGNAADSDDSSDPGSSGYETDMGDTTDEYDSEFDAEAVPRTPQQRSVLHRPSSAPASRVTSPRPFLRTAKGPTRGIFIHEDSHEAIAVTNRNKSLTFYRPRAPIALRQPRYGVYSSTSSTTNNSPRTSVQQLNHSDSELSNDPFSNAFFNSTDIMLTGIFGSAPSNPYLFGSASVGPPEAFYPFTNFGSNGNVISDDEDEYEDDDEFEDDLNITDFMDFGSDIDVTDVEQDEETDVPATPATSMVAINGSTPAQMTETPVNRRRDVSDAMLEHFDRAGVTAFRNNQDRFRDIACLPHDPNLRASVSKPIRSGRSAETLISPLRKRSSMAKKHGSSPFAGVTKATGRLQSSVMNGNGRKGPPRMGTFS